MCVGCFISVLCLSVLCYVCLLCGCGCVSRRPESQGRVQGILWKLVVPRKTAGVWGIDWDLSITTSSLEALVII